MNAAKLNRSDRLKRVKRFLSDRKPHSIWDIMRHAKVCAVSAIVAELRANGVPITCQRKGDVWFYEMRGTPKCRTD